MNPVHKPKLKILKWVILSPVVLCGKSEGPSFRLALLPLRRLLKRGRRLGRLGHSVFVVEKGLDVVGRIVSCHSTG